MDRITELKNKIDFLETEIRPLKIELRQLQFLEDQEKAEFKRGDIVTIRNGKRKAKIVDAFRRYDSYEYTANTIRKDGSLGELFSIRTWDKPVKSQ